MKIRNKGHQRKLAHEFHELAGDAYNELHSRYPKTAVAMASLGTLVPSLVDRAPGLTSSFFKGKGKH